MGRGHKEVKGRKEVGRRNDERRGIVSDVSVHPKQFNVGQPRSPACRLRGHFRR